MKDLIHIDLVPNFQEDDYQIIKDSLKEKYKKNDFEKIEEKILEIFRNYFPKGELFFFNSARSALAFLLKTISEKLEIDLNKPNSYSNKSKALNKNLSQGKNQNESEAEIVTQAFSCLVVPNSIKFAGYKPIYTDIDESYNISPEDLKNKISYKTKAIIIQNTFGLPAKIEEILKIANQNYILVIENLTHSLGALFKNEYLGNFGEVALLSFNRNKVISSITGGALVINNKELATKIKNYYSQLPDISQKEIKKILLTGKILYEAKNKYNFLTKVYLKILRKTRITLEMISEREKSGIFLKDSIYKMPKNLYPLLLNQLKKLEDFKQQRKKISNIYQDFFNNLEKQNIYHNFQINQDSSPIFLRYPVLSEERNKIIQDFKFKNIYLGDWYNCVLAPCPNFVKKEDINIFLEKFDYNIGSCRVAEKISKFSLNLPTLIKETEALRIIEIISEIKF